MRDTNRQFGNFFDQEPDMSADAVKLLASTDMSAPYEVDEHGIFLLANGKFAYVAISGCSCWPDRGGTEVIEADSLPELQEKVKFTDGEYSRGLGLASWQALIQEATKSA